VSALRCNAAIFHSDNQLDDVFQIAALQRNAVSSKTQIIRCKIRQIRVAHLAACVC
jgi:hypothetical protein